MMDDKEIYFKTRARLSMVLLNDHPTPFDMIVELSKEIDRYRERIKHMENIIEKQREIMANPEKTAPATGEIMVNREEYTKAVNQAIANAAKDQKLEGMSSIIYAMCGASFASEVEIILFGNNEG